MASQNARRLARLCLSVSTRWLNQFEGTHKSAVSRMVSSGAGGHNAPLFKRLANELFDA